MPHNIGVMCPVLNEARRLRHKYLVKLFLAVVFAVAASVPHAALADGSALVLPSWAHAPSESALKLVLPKWTRETAQRPRRVQATVARLSSSVRVVPAMTVAERRAAAELAVKRAATAPSLRSGERALRMASALFRANRRSLSYCDRLAKRRGEAVPTRVYFTVKVARDGGVQVLARAAASERALSCYRSLTRAMQFPRASEDYELTFTRVMRVRAK